MKRYLLYIVLTVVLSTAGCTRGQWLDEVVAQRDEQEDVVPILRAAKEKGLTVNSVEEIERTNKHYTADTANGYYNEFKRYRLLFSDQTTVEFDVLGTLNGVKSDYYEKRELFYISEISWSDSNYLRIDLFNPAGGGVQWQLSFLFTATIDDPNDNPNDNITYEIYYTSTDGQVVTPNDTTAFGANIVSNTYKNGQGVITFDGYVTSIGGGAFYGCSAIESITIPESVTSIGDSAFTECSSLAEFSGKFASEDGRCLIVDGVLKSFAIGCGLTEYTIPEGVTSIGNEAFYNCSSLTSITIPEGVTSIGDSAFRYCSSLVSITIPDGVTSIGYYAFYACSSLASITIPDSVTSIGDRAFRDCSSLASVTIGNGVTSIGEYAFYDCSSLASVTIGNGVTSIGTQAFYGCSSLAEVYCKATTPPTAIISNSLYGWGAFTSNASGRKIYVPTESVEAYKTADGWSNYADAFVPYDFEKGEIVYSETQKIYYTSTDGNVVTPFRSGTSYFGANIISNTYADGQGVITFDGEVTKIGSEAYYNRTTLASITIPESVTSIGHSAFRECLSLASITIPEGVTSIGVCVFNRCSSLASITIPDGVTYIGYAAFSGCSSLVSITIPEGVTSIGSSAFNGCTSLASITIPNSVTSIGDYAFRDCSSLASITIPASVTSIGDYAFYVCSSLTSITIPDGVTSIGDCAFAYCSSLASITIPASVTSIGSQAFYGCDSLTSVTIGNGVTSIGELAFCSCSGLMKFEGKFASEDGRCLIVNGKLNSFAPAGLTEYVIPNGVTTIGRRAFFECDELVSVTIPDGVTSIEEDAFCGCDNLASINIPEGVTEIGDYAFGLTKLKSVTLPESLTSLGRIAFTDCYSLKKVYCKAITPPTAIPNSSYGWGAFDSNASGRKIYVPTKSVGAYKTAEWWSEYADAIEPYVFE